MSSINYKSVLGILSSEVQQLCRIIILTIIFLWNCAILVGQEENMQVVKLVCPEDLNFLKSNTFLLSESENLELELNKIRKSAILNSYLAFSIDSVVHVDDSIFVQVHRGQDYVVDETRIMIDSDSANYKMATKKLFLGKFPLGNLKNAQSNLLSFYENNGYPFVKMELDELVEEENKTIAFLKLHKGPKYKIDSLVVKSESLISPRLLFNRINIKKGDSYNEEKVSQVVERINEIGYMSLERSPEVVFAKEKAYLYLFLKKKSNNRLNGLVGFIPNDDGKIEFTGNLELQLANALGADEFLDFNWRKLQQKSQDLKINFSYPYLFNLDVGFEQNLSIYRHDTTYTEVKSRSSLQYLFSRYNYVSFFVQTRTYNSLLNVDEGQLNPESNITQYGLGGQFSSLDYRFNPRSGVNANVNVAVGDKTIQGANIDFDNEGVSQQQLTIDGQISYYHPLRKRSVIKNSLTVGYIQNDFIIENELYRLGGIKSIRGFDEEAFNASNFGLLSVEYRFLTDLNSYFSGFAEYMSFEKRSIEAESIANGNAVGFGVGAAFETKAGIFSLNYALGSLNNAPFLVRSGKIHFGFNAIF